MFDRVLNEWRSYDEVSGGGVGYLRTGEAHTVAINARAAAAAIDFLSSARGDHCAPVYFRSSPVYNSVGIYSHSKQHLGTAHTAAYTLDCWRRFLHFSPLSFCGPFYFAYSYDDSSSLSSGISDPWNDVYGLHFKVQYK